MLATQLESAKVMEQGLTAGTNNMLRMARSGCQSASAFMALDLGADSFASAVYPVAAEPGAVEAATVDIVVRQLCEDASLGRGKAIVRTLPVGEERLAIAAVPLGSNDQGRPLGILGVADQSRRSFGVPDLEVLSRIGQRLASYVQARRVVRDQVERMLQAGVPAPGKAADWGELPLPSPASVLGAPGDCTPHALPTSAHQAGSFRSVLDTEQDIDGLVSLGSLLGRAGRLLGAASSIGAGSSASGTLAVVAVEFEGLSGATTDQVAHIVRSMRTGLRFDDPVARVGELCFVAVVSLVPGSVTAAQVEAHVRERARAAANGLPGANVRVAHAAAPLNGGRDADELLRDAVVKLRAR